MMTKTGPISGLAATLLLACCTAHATVEEPASKDTQVQDQSLPQASAGIDLLAILMSAVDPNDVENRPPPPPPVAAPFGVSLKP